MILIIVGLYMLLHVAMYFIFRAQVLSASKWTYFLQFSLFTLFVNTLLLFGLAFLFSGAHYQDAIDPIDTGYSPLAQEHALSYLTFLLAWIVSALALWLKMDKLSPLVALITSAFLTIGPGFSIGILGQVISVNDNSFLFALMPIFQLTISILLFTKLLKQRAAIAKNYNYTNKFLRKLNEYSAFIVKMPVLLLLFSLPVFIVVTLLLLIFGQAPDSAVKLFTETTTWNFSQKTHPPFLDHQGHYLCTVAACGSPKLVKPVGLGERNGQAIIINRQLQIANAFEELILDFSPMLHKVIRAFYDKYGYGFSRHITTSRRSNLIYLFMKPLEWFFLLILYLCCSKPENKITKQYR